MVQLSGCGLAAAVGTGVSAAAFAPGAEGVRPMQPGAAVGVADVEAPPESDTQRLVYGPERFPAKPLSVFESLASALGERLEASAGTAMFAGGALVADLVDPSMTSMSPFTIAVVAMFVALGVAIPLARGIIVERRRSREEQPKIDLNRVAGAEADFVRSFLSSSIPRAAHGSPRLGGVTLSEKLDKYRADLKRDAERFFQDVGTTSNEFVDAFNQLAREYARISADRSPSGAPKHRQAVKKTRIQLEVLGGHPAIAGDERAATIREVLESTPNFFPNDDGDDEHF